MFFMIRTANDLSPKYAGLLTSFLALCMASTNLLAQQAVPLRHWESPLFWQPGSTELSSGTASRAQSVSSTDPLIFVAMTPCRVVDTRTGQGFPAAFGSPRLAGAATRTFPIAANSTCSISPSAEAYSFNVTVVPPGPLGFITIYPTGQAQPLAATLNSLQGYIVANAAIVAAGTAGSIDVYASDPTDLVIDLNGYYTSHAQFSLMQGTSNTPALTFGAGTAAGLYSSGNGAVDIATNGVDRLTVNSAGNVGIGTNAPTQSFQINNTNDFGGIDIKTPNTGMHQAFTVTHAEGSPFQLFTQYVGSVPLTEIWSGGNGTLRISNNRFSVNGSVTSPATDPVFSVRNSSLSPTVPLSAVTAQFVQSSAQTGDILQAVSNDILRFNVTSSGNVGVGTSTPRDAFEVQGDIRLSGCVRDNAGNQITGTCSSDLRLKTNVQPFLPVLDRLTRLQPVYFDWRTTNGPGYRFGSVRSGGLIAQDVEDQFPEMVSTDRQGYKAVNYGELPLLLLQAIRDLKVENDNLRTQLNDEQTRSREANEHVRSLDTRIADLERFLTKVGDRDSSQK